MLRGVKLKFDFDSGTESPSCIELQINQAESCVIIVKGRKLKQELNSRPRKMQFMDFMPPSLYFRTNWRKHRNGIMEEKQKDGGVWCSGRGKLSKIFRERYHCQREIQILKFECNMSEIYLIYNFFLEKIIVFKFGSFFKIIVLINCS